MQCSSYLDNVSAGVNRGVEDNPTGHLTRGIQNQEMALLHTGREQVKKILTHKNSCISNMTIVTKTPMQNK